MSYRAIISPKSLDNWYKAWSSYEKKQKGLGDKFEEALFERLRIIGEGPNSCRKLRKPYREIILVGYPYQMLYTIDEQLKLLPFIQLGILAAVQKINTNKTFQLFWFSLLEKFQAALFAEHTLMTQFKLSLSSPHGRIAATDQ